jgi:O-acetyl-ADP-ribose deacetylase (regulator of RNase III)
MIHGTIAILKGDITTLDADAIVNAANSGLLGGGGVDGAIHRAGGPSIIEACRKYISEHGMLETGNAMITAGGNLAAKYVIHTVGPVWKEGNANQNHLLRNAYVNSLKLAASKGLETIAFPNISTGVYRFPKELAAGIALDSVCDFLTTASSITKVFFVCFDEENYLLYKKEMLTRGLST